MAKTLFSSPDRSRSETGPVIRRLLVLLLMAAGMFNACAPSSRSGEAAIIDAPFSPVFRTAKFPEIDDAISQAISNGAAPGAVLWIERHGTAYHHAYGRRAVLPQPEPMTEDTIFDAASLTKVLATTPAIMQLLEDGKLQLDAPVKTYLPEFMGLGRDAVTLRHLLTHTSGLPPGIPLRPEWSGYDAGIQRALTESPRNPPGSRFRYSDINFILLGEIVRRVAGEGLDRFCETHIYEPLGMTNTGFLPPATRRARIAPTTEINGRFLRGTVHDPTSRRMGGIAGHAGLFTTAADVARYARMMLNGGELDGTRIFQSNTVGWMTSVQSPPSVPDARRGLGWDIDSPYAGPRGEYFPVGSYGHTGWTGGSLWIDPFSRTFVILLSNRNHPTEDGNVIALRRRVGTLAAEAVEGFNFAGVPGALPRWDRTTSGMGAGASGAGPGHAASTTSEPSSADAGVKNGIDVLVAEHFAPLRKLRIGLITNHTGADRNRDPTIDLLKDAPEVDLRALFSPEHGIRGEQDAKVSDATDPKTGLPIFSLYGATRQPTADQLAGLDALVFDIQDIGCRFYTYLSTMGLCLEAAAAHRLRFFVLDRVNPITGSHVEGPVRAGPDSSFVAFHPVPVRHGMTAGELARMFNAEREWKADLTVIPVEGWRRDAWLDETGLPWIRTSPNMRNLTEAIFYPGIGLLESAVSVGRGTDTPFELVGAPYVQDRALAAAMTAAHLPGVAFVPIRFTPNSSVFKGQECGGVYLLVTDRDRIRPVDVGIELARTLHRLYPGEFALDKMAPLLRHPATLEAIREGRSLVEIKALWASDLGEFMARRGPFLLY